MAVASSPPMRIYPASRFRVGQAIGAGNSVGRVGSTGRSTGPHLHYEIRKDDRSIDPMAHLLTGREIVGLL